MRMSPPTPEATKVYAGTKLLVATPTAASSASYDVSSGAKIWMRRYDGPAHGADQGIAIAYDASSGVVTVTGRSEKIAGSGQPDAATIP
jgi:hypothetical protein